MPLIRGKKDSVNSRSIIDKPWKGKRSITIPEEVILDENVYVGTAAENIPQGAPIYESNNFIYIASNKFSDRKPCMGIAIQPASPGDIIQYQVSGLVYGLSNLAKGKDHFLRSSGLSSIPLVIHNSNEDCYQLIGYAKETSVLHLNIQKIALIL